MLLVQRGRVYAHIHPLRPIFSTEQRTKRHFPTVDSAADTLCANGSRAGRIMPRVGVKTSPVPGNTYTSTRTWPCETARPRNAPVLSASFPLCNLSGNWTLVGGGSGSKRFVASWLKNIKKPQEKKKQLALCKRIYRQACRIVDFPFFLVRFLLTLRI